MKSMLYVGAALMFAACIYGFVDYKKASRNKKFNSLYHEEKQEPVSSKKVEPGTLSKEGLFVEGKNNNDKFSSKNQVSKKELGEEKVSKTGTTKDETMETKPGKVFEALKVKKNKKLNYKLFSRAPLREYSEEVILPEAIDLKSEEAKSVNQ